MVFASAIAPLRRVMAAGLTLIVAFALVFAAAAAIPGDPVDWMLGERALPAQRAELQRTLGLDRSAGEKLRDDFLRLARGDLGESLVLRRAVRDLIAERVGPTVALSGAALVTAIALGFPAGTVAAIAPASLAGRLASLYGAAGAAATAIWLGPLLISVFAVRLRWLPAGGYRTFAALLLPALTLGVPLGASMCRLTRAAVAETLRAPFTRTALAKGLSPAAVVRRHVLPAAALPLLTLITLQLGALLAGAVVTETIFQWPGMGRLLVQAVHARDFPTVQGVVLVLTALYVTLHTALDALMVMLDPRTRRNGP